MSRKSELLKLWKSQGLDAKLEKRLFKGRETIELTRKQYSHIILTVILLCDKILEQEIPKMVEKAWEEYQKL